MRVGKLGEKGDPSTVGPDGSRAPGRGGRGLFGGGLDPSAPGKLQKRLANAKDETKTKPVIEKFSQLHEVHKVDGMDSFDNVFQRIADIIEPPVM